MIAFARYLLGWAAGCFVVAGFLATEEQWIEFDRNRNDCLRDFGVSGLHMKLFAHSRRDFVSWKGNEHKRRLFLVRLINIIATASARPYR